jgi:hypothetical protein
MSGGYRAKIPLTDDEERIVKEYIFLPLIRMALERDKKVINITNTKFKEHYIELINEAIHHVTSDMRKNKDDIFNYHIRMTKRNWLSYEVYCKGYVYDFVFHKSIASDWINERIKVYFK